MKSTRWWRCRGSGTFEELLEAITWKRLGLFLNPIVIVNQDGFYDADVVAGIKAAPGWSEDARQFAAP
jgi:predicted Rossmann-fold nucleotide-binding protein